MKVGDKFIVNKSMKGVVEIIGFYPAGQGMIKEDAFEVLINGLKAILPLSLIEELFKPVREVENAN